MLFDEMLTAARGPCMMRLELPTSRPPSTSYIRETGVQDTDTARVRIASTTPGASYASSHPLASSDTANEDKPAPSSFAPINDPPAARSNSSVDDVQLTPKSPAASAPYGTSRRHSRSPRRLAAGRGDDQSNKYHGVLVMAFNFEGDRDCHSSYLLVSSALGPH